MMITCKEDLRKCYVHPRDKEAYEALMDKCEEFGVKWRSGRAPREYVQREAVAVGYFGELSLTGGNNVIGDPEFKRLTLSDLKPRTKQYAILYKGGGYSFQSDKPIGNNIVACFDLSHSEESLGGDFFDKRPRTKVEYVKCEFDSDYQHLKLMIDGESLFDCRGDVEYKFDGCGFVSVIGFDTYKNTKWDAKRPSELYRRIETPITEREAFIEEVAKCLMNASDPMSPGAALFDSGKFKLVN